MKHLSQLQEKLEPQTWFLVPHTDAFQGEYIASHDERLAWISGFTGSAGAAVISRDEAVLFVDGRYVTQAPKQVDSAWRVIHTADQTLEIFLDQVLESGHTVMIDAWLHTFSEYKRLEEICQKNHSELKLLSENPIDVLWTERPHPHITPIQPHSTVFAGISSEEKRRNLANASEADSVLLSNCSSIAWLLNIRGQDIPYNPIVQAYALLHKDETVDLFVLPEKVTAQAREHMGESVRLHPFTSFASYLTAYSGQSICLDSQQVPVILAQILQQNTKVKIIWKQDPCALPKAIKNTAEITGAVASHVRDGVALTRFLAWLDGQSTPEQLTEIDCAEKLLNFRQEGERFQDLSFATISAAGSNGAIIHYCPKPETNRRLERGNLYLVDSGAQYLDGTTDVTRTIAIGATTPEQCYHFTLVLKGHIALANVRFPKGTTGSQLDILARQYLWQAGLDYSHGTGHGVGSYLNVHEGPQRISKACSNQALLSGMILSNEPGYYVTGAYGIRIESLVFVKEQIDLSDWFEFQTLTLVPIDRRLILTDLLTSTERNWLNQYHHRVYNTLNPFLDTQTQTWLQEATALI